MTAATAALIGRGAVRHLRLRPVEHAFSYPTFFLMLPMRALRERGSPGIARNRFGLISFHDADHGDGRADALAWLDQLLAAEGVRGADGEVWLHTYPRVLGYAFKPVSFWYCHDRAGALVAVLVEVNNTFGERHCYLLDGARWGRELVATKVFHVSPFCRVAGRYRFRFLRSGERLVARIDHDDEAGPLLQTSISGRLETLDRAAALRAFAALPLLGLGVIARIHWQALRLWLRRVPYWRKPAPPELFVTR